MEKQHKQTNKTHTHKHTKLSKHSKTNNKLRNTIITNREETTIKNNIINKKNKKKSNQQQQQMHNTKQTTKIN